MCLQIRNVQFRGPLIERSDPGIEEESKMTMPIIAAISAVMSVCVIGLIIISAVSIITGTMLKTCLEILRVSLSLL